MKIELQRAAYRLLTRVSGTSTPVRVPLDTLAFRGYAEFRDWGDRREAQEEYRRLRAAESALIRGGSRFVVYGYCYVCGAPSTFVVDCPSSGDAPQGARTPNWRESVVCTDCGLNNRIRSSVQFLEQNLGCGPDAAIYISEQATPLYHYLHKHYPHTVGSEYFGDRIALGATDPGSGYRNESCTRLTFGDASFDYLLSFDVLEHVPAYETALGEAARCLKPGGWLMFTAPFDLNAAHTQVRARLDSDGNVTHLLPPLYHGDPVNKEGILCFYTFGWDLLDGLRTAGFRRVEVHQFSNLEFAYPGHQILLTARR